MDERKRIWFFIAVHNMFKLEEEDRNVMLFKISGEIKSAEELEYVLSLILGR